MPITSAYETPIEGTSVTTLTDPSVIPSGSDRGLLALLAFIDRDPDGDVTSIDFNTSEALNVASEGVDEAKISNDDAGRTRMATIYELEAPSAVDADLEAIVSTTFDAGALIGVLLNGVHQSDMIGAVASAIGPPGGPQVDITTTEADSLIVVLAMMQDPDTTFTALADTTEKVNDAVGNMTYFAGERSEATPGTYTVGVSSSDSAQWACVAVEILNAAAGGETVEVPTGTLDLSGETPVVSTTNDQSIEIPIGALDLLGQAPVVSVTDDQNVETPLATLDLLGQAPSVSITANQSVEIPPAALDLLGEVPTISVSGNQAVEIPLGTLDLSGQSPVVSVSDDQVVEVPLGTLDLTGRTPDASTSNHQIAQTPTGTLNLLGHAPVVSVGDEQTVQTPTGTLDLVGYAPSVSAPVSVPVPTGTIDITGLSPTAVIGIFVDVPLGTLSITGLLPSVEISDHKVVPVPSGTLIATGLEPDIIAGQSVIIPVPLGTLDLVGILPTASVTGVAIQVEAVRLTSGILTSISAVSGILTSINATSGIKTQIDLESDLDVEEIIS